MPEWMNVIFDELGKITKVIKEDWPKELPSDTDPKFWEMATRQEFEHRNELTGKIRLALSGDYGSAASWSPIEVWLYNVRVQWLMQLLLEWAKRGGKSPKLPSDILTDTLCDQWAREGAVAFFDHAMMRDGQPHPDVDEDYLRLLNS